MDYYIMYADVSVEEYLVPGPEINSLLRGCQFSEFQFLDRAPLDVSISADGGLEFPDLMIREGCIPLVSPAMRAAFLAIGLDNVFYKPVNLVLERLGLREPCWLALPPRIDCLDWEECEILEDDDPAFPFWARLSEARRIVIDPAKTGRYKIFKLPPSLCNQQIIVDGELKSFLEMGSFENVHFFKLN